MGLDGYGLEVGCNADFVLLQAADPIEAIRLRAPRLCGGAARQGRSPRRRPGATLSLPGRPRARRSGRAMRLEGARPVSADSAACSFAARRRAHSSGNENGTAGGGDDDQASQWTRAGLPCGSAACAAGSRAALPRSARAEDKKLKVAGDLLHADRGALGQPDPRRPAEGREGARHRIQMVGEGAGRRFRPRLREYAHRRLSSSCSATPSRPSASRAARPRSSRRSPSCSAPAPGPAEPNFGVFDNWIHEPAYLSGMIAGKMTEVEHGRRRRGDGHPGGQPAGQRLLRRRQGGQSRRQEARSPSSARSSIRRRPRRPRSRRSTPAST